MAAARCVVCVCVCVHPAAPTFRSPQGFRLQLPCPHPPPVASPPHYHLPAASILLRCGLPRSHTHSLHPCDGLTPPSLVPPLRVSTPPSRPYSLSCPFPGSLSSSLPSLSLSSSSLSLSIAWLAGLLAAARLGSRHTANWTTREGQSLVLANLIRGKKKKNVTDCNICLQFSLVFSSSSSVIGNVTNKKKRKEGKEKCLLHYWIIYYFHSPLPPHPPALSLPLPLPLLVC